MIRAIALDIDGTITFENRELDTSSVEPIRKAEKSGILVCLATGNILCYAQATSVLLGTSGPLIAEDGGVVYDKTNEEKHILAGLEKVDRGIKILEEEFDNIQHTSSSDMRQAGRTLERTINAKDAENIFKERGLDITAVDSGFAIHVKDSKVSKGNALKKISSLIGCSISEIAAIGDGENDVEMLEKTSLSFAPANASSEAKEASSHVTENSHGSGVREAIEQIIMKNNN